MLQDHHPHLSTALTIGIGTNKMGGKEDKEVRPRQVAVAIPYCQIGTEIRICLVSSRKHDDRFVLPKGGVEKGEEIWQTAIREMWEEAGLKPSTGWIELEKKDEAFIIGSIDDHKPHKHSLALDSSSPSFVPRARYTAILVNVHQGNSDCELNEWPEKNERKRIWTSYENACKEIKWRKDIYILLLQAEQRLKANEILFSS